MILKYLTKKSIFLIFVCFAIIILQVYLELRIPYYTEKMIRLPEGSTIYDVMEYGRGMLVCTALSLVCAIITTCICAYVAGTFAADMRLRMFTKIQSFSSTEMNKFTTSSLMTRTTNDINRVQMLIAMGMMILIRSPAMAVIALIDLSDDNQEWMLAMAVSIITVFIFIIVAFMYVTPRFERVQAFIDNLNRQILENLKGKYVVRAFNAETYQGKKFEDVNEPYTKNDIQAMSMMALMMPTLTALIGILTVFIYYSGTWLIVDDPASGQKIFGQMIVFSQYAVQIIMSIILLVVVLMNYSRAAVSAKRIEEVLDTDISIVSGPVKKGKEGHEGEIVFDKVSLRYPGSTDNILSDISFDVKKGETLAIVGPIGCGKTSIVNLMPRFHDCTSGNVYVDGVNVKDYDLESLYGKFGYVSQKPIMFNRTIDENIRFGDNSKSCSKEDLEKSMEMAQASEFVSKLSDGADYKILEGGSNLSGGQKQRISIARAICKKPEFYIFDDSFSALDYKTDQMLRESLKKEVTGITTIIVAQRIGTIKNADKILVVNEGKLVGVGKHDELLRTCGIYKEIVMSQMTAEDVM